MFPAGEIRGQLFQRVDAVATTVLTGAEETPPVVTAATGSAESRLRRSTLIVTGDFSGLESDLMDVGDVGPAHIHVGERGVDGPVVFPIAVDSADLRSGRLLLETVLADQERLDYLAGLHYVNIHTEQNPGGEIRGQLEP